MQKKKPRKKIRVVFICTGNTCRSPMAVGILADLLAGRELGHLVSICSAGLMADAGLPASPEAIAVCADRGIDIGGHRSRQLTEKIIKEADLLLVMQKTHLAMMSQNRQAVDKDLRLLGEFHPDSGGVLDILDPFGGGNEMYRLIFDHLGECMKGLVDYLLERLENGAVEKK